jgi:hypothetical protein
MIERNINRSTQRYPRGKVFAESLTKGRSYSTFYSKGKEGKVQREGEGENRLASLKEFIDNYFEE